MKFLEFMFHDFFTFTGMILLIAIILGGVADIIRAMK